MSKKSLSIFQDIINSNENIEFVRNYIEVIGISEIKFIQNLDISTYLNNSDPQFSPTFISIVEIKKINSCISEIINLKKDLSKGFFSKLFSFSRSSSKSFIKTFKSNTENISTSLQSLLNMSVDIDMQLLENKEKVSKINIVIILDLNNHLKLLNDILTDIEDYCELSNPFLENTVRGIILSQIIRLENIKTILSQFLESISIILDSINKLPPLLRQFNLIFEKIQYVSNNFSSEDLESKELFIIIDDLVVDICSIQSVIENNLSSENNNYVRINEAEEKLLFFK